MFYLLACTLLRYRHSRTAQIPELGLSVATAIKLYEYARIRSSEPASQLCSETTTSIFTPALALRSSVSVVQLQLLNESMWNEHAHKHTHRAYIWWVEEKRLMFWNL